MIWKSIRLELLAILLEVGVFIILLNLEEGSFATIQSIDGGKSVRSRLLGIGIIPGDIIKMLICREKGAILVEVLGQQICLGRGIAEKIKII